MGRPICRLGHVREATRVPNVSSRNYSYRCGPLPLWDRWDSIYRELLEGIYIWAEAGTKACHPNSLRGGVPCPAVPNTPDENNPAGVQ